MADRARHDVNLDPTLIAVSNADGESPVSLWADPGTHLLQVGGTLSVGGAADGTASAVLGALNAVVSIVLAGQYGVAVNFPAGLVGTVTPEVSTDGGTTWTATTFIAIGVSQVETATLVNPTGQYSILVQGGVSNVRVRVSAYTSGSITATLRTTTAQTLFDTVQLTDGTNQANVLKSDGTAAGQNSLLTAGTYLSVPFTTTTAQAVGSTDAGNYRSVSVFIATQGGSSTIAFQQSSDNSNWENIALSKPAIGTPVFTTTTAGNHWVGNLSARYFRVNVTGIISGTTAGTIIFSTFPPSQLTNFSLQQGTWTVGSNSATGSAVPANLFGIAVSDGTNLQPLRSVNGAADGVSTPLASGGYVYNGTNYDRLRTPTKFIPINAVSIATETTIWTPTAGKKFRIMGYALSLGVVGSAVTIKDNTAGTTILIIPANTIGVVQLSPAMGNGILSAAANNVLTATGVATQTLTGYVFGTEE